MSKKFLELEASARIGVKNLNDKISLSANVNDMNIVLNQLLDLVYRYAAKNNNRPNKALKLFSEFSKIELSREEKIKQQQKLKTYKDYLPQLQVLRNRGASYQELSNYAKEHFEVKVSRETLRNSLQEVSNV
jgi:hypothetical protein